MDSMSPAFSPSIQWHVYVALVTSRRIFILIYVVLPFPSLSSLAVPSSYRVDHEVYRDRPLLFGQNSPVLESALRHRRRRGALTATRRLNSSCGDRG